MFGFGFFDLQFDDDETLSGEKQIKKQPGETCVRCKEYNQYAEPNQKNGTFKCYKCRVFPFL